MTRTIRRTFVASLLLLLVAGIAAIAYLAVSLDAIVARTIEREGSRALGAPVSVANVEIELSEGVGTIRSLRVANPDGFRQEDAFELAEIVLAIEPASLGNAPVRLSRVEVGQTQVNLEVDEQGQTNLDRIVRHVRQRGDEKPVAKGEAPTKIAIERLAFEGGTVRLDRPDRESGDAVTLAGFARERVGGSEGATGGEIARTVTLALARQTAASTAGSKAAEAVEDELGGAAGEAAGSIVRGLLGE